MAASLCVAIVATTFGVGGVACAVIVGGTLGYAGGEAGGLLGEKAGNMIYNVIEGPK